MLYALTSKGIEEALYVEEGEEEEKEEEVGNGGVELDKSVSTLTC